MKGLREVAKAIEMHATQLCVLAENCVIMSSWLRHFALNTMVTVLVPRLCLVLKLLRVRGALRD